MDKAEDKSKASDLSVTEAPDYAAGTSSSTEDAPQGFLTRLKQKIQIEPEPGTFAPGRWSNADLDPIPPEQRTWRTINYVFYWTNDAMSPGNLRLGSSLYSLGLSWKLTLVAIVLGHGLMAIGLTLNGIVGSRFHIPYTIQSRAPFGFFFSFVVIFVRMVVASFWYGINTATGAECIRAILIAIWPSFANIPNHLPKSANITTQTMCAYILYFLFVLPFHYIHPRKLRWFFAIKAAICIPAVTGMLIWACTSTGGGLNNVVFERGNTVTGSKLGWVFMHGLNAMLGNYGTMAVNINDYTRYAKNPRTTYIQLIIIPCAFLMMGFFGLVIVGSAEKLYGVLQWDVLSIMDNWNGSSKARAGAVFAGGAMAIAQMGTNLGANCVSAANDLNAMFPKYINIRRGQYIIAFLGAWALTPWNILASASSLVTFMGGYAIFLAPISGVLVADFWLVHRKSYHVPDMYDPHGRYRYNRWGTNWRAAVSWSMGWIPLLPGLVHSVGGSGIAVSSGAQNLYDLGYLYGILTSAALYTILSTAFPPKSTMYHESGSEVE